MPKIKTVLKGKRKKTQLYKQKYFHSISQAKIFLGVMWSKTTFKKKKIPNHITFHVHHKKPNVWQLLIYFKNENQKQNNYYWERVDNKIKQK